MQVQLLGGIVDALVWTSQQRLGVFSTQFSPSAFMLESEGDSIGGVQRERSMVRELRDGVPALEAHHTWLLFLLETWQVGICQQALRLGSTSEHQCMPKGELPGKLQCFLKTLAAGKSKHPSWQICGPCACGANKQRGAHVQVVESGPSPQHRAARAVLQRGLLAVLAGGRQLSQHPAAAGAVYRLLLLALQTAG